MRSGYWQELTTRDFAAVDVERTIAVLPVAAVEQHGPHLPVATDALINAGLVRAALPRVPDDVAALVLETD
jgi:creatinine amidohydrolase